MRREVMPSLHVGTRCLVMALMSRPWKPKLNLLELPEDVLMCIFSYLPITDLLAFQAAHPQLRHLVQSHPSVWANLSLQGMWPCPNTIQLFQQASVCGNFEASVKLALAYLYNEGIAVADESRPERNGRKAAHYFSLAEHLSCGNVGMAVPFVWIFIRPPWSMSGACCKAVVFDSLKSECEEAKTNGARLLYCLGKVLGFFDDEEKRSEALRLFDASAQEGCVLSAYLTWKSRHHSVASDPGQLLQNLRRLREFSDRGCWEAQVSLAVALTQAFSGGWLMRAEVSAAQHSVSRFFQSSSPTRAHRLYRVQKGMNENMRYLLIDWLAEVVTTKELSSACLHTTVQCLDRYLLQRPVERSKLQLLGIACMVICSRFLSQDILTIREGVWLTDNTYKYEDMVRMMGEIISVLGGRIMAPMVLEFVRVLLALEPLEERASCTLSYVCELSLLFTSVTAYSPAHLATSAFLLTRILHQHAVPWSKKLVDFTGFSLEDLIPCTLLLHKQCFLDEVPKDHREVSLIAVRQRFSDDRYQRVSEDKVLDYAELCAVLGVRVEPLCLFLPSVSAQATGSPPFLTSPPQHKSKRRREDSERESLAATPIMELSYQAEEEEEEGGGAQFPDVDAEYHADEQLDEEALSVLCDDADQCLLDRSVSSETTDVLSNAFLLTSDYSNMDIGENDDYDDEEEEEESVCESCDTSEACTFLLDTTTQPEWGGGGPAGHAECTASGTPSSLVPPLWPSIVAGTTRPGTSSALGHSPFPSAPGAGPSGRGLVAAAVVPANPDAPFPFRTILCNGQADAKHDEPRQRAKRKNVTSHHGVENADVTSQHA